MFFTVPQGVAGCVHVFLSWVAGPSCFVMYFSLYEPFCVTEAVSEMDAAFWVGREVGPQESGHCKRMVLPRVDCRVYCLLAAGRLSVKTTILLHPVAMALVMASRMAKSSASVDVALAEGYSLPAMIFSQDDVTCDARQKPC